MIRATLFPLIAAVPAIAFALAACAGSSDDQSADSADSAAGEPVVVYSGRSEELIEPLFEKFTEETGVPVEVRYGDTAEMAAQIIEEGDASPADVYYGQDAGALGALDGAGMCAPLADSSAGSGSGARKTSHALNQLTLPALEDIVVPFFFSDL